MAKNDVTAKSSDVSDEPNVELLTVAPADWNFTTVSDVSPTAVELELGESIILHFEGIEHIVPDNAKDEPFDLLIFTGRDDERYSMNPSYKLSRYFKDAPMEWYRITLVKEIETGRGLNSMKDYRIEMKK